VRPFSTEVRDYSNGFSKLRQRAHRQQEQPGQCLRSRDDSNPSDGFERTLAGPQAPNSITGIELLEFARLGRGTIRVPWHDRKVSFGKISRTFAHLRLA